MRLRFKTLGILEEIITNNEFSFPGDAISLSQFFRYLADCYGSTVAKHLMPEGAFSSHYAILVNGTNIMLLKGLDTELKDGDRIMAYTIVAGG